MFPTGQCIGQCQVSCRNDPLSVRMSFNLQSIYFVEITLSDATANFLVVLLDDVKMGKKTC